MLRCQFAELFRKWVDREGVGQAQAAKRLAVVQPRISEIACNKVDKLWLDYLMGLRAKGKSAAYMHKIGWELQESAVSVVRPARTRDAGKDDARCSTS